jgi:hypothetical protein
MGFEDEAEQSFEALLVALKREGSKTVNAFFRCCWG